jgi:hypothetical protein
MPARPLSSNATKIAALLEERAADYFAELHGESSTARLEHSSLRPFSELYEFTIQSDVMARRVFVKIPFLDHSRPQAEADRPRLFPPVIPKQMALLEYNAMQQIRDQFSASGDARFGSVRVLDLLQQPDALVMAKVEGMTLRRASAHAAKRKTRDGDFGIVFQNVGEWLSRYHQLPSLEQTTERSATRADFVAGTERFLDYLAAAGAARWMLSLGESLIRESESTLPETLPLGLAHGDFAPRNVIVSPDHRITVLDTLARWRAPIYEDIALFLLSLRLRSSLQTLWSSEPPQPAGSARAFLAGYFGASRIDGDWPVIRLFLLQALLDRACSYVASRSNGGPVAGFKRTCKLYVLRRLASQIVAAGAA